MLLAAGALLLALGLFSGAVLVLAPLGWIAADPHLTLWVTFPVLSLAGFAVFATHARDEHVRVVSLVGSAILLLLAMASIAAIVLSAASFVPALTSTAPLWYVLVIGFAIGSIGAASFRRAPPGPQV